MAPVTILITFILFGLSALCFWLPFKNGHKKLGSVVGILLSLIIIWSFIEHLDFLVLFIWPLIIAFQIIFLTYWTFRNFGKHKTGVILAVALLVVLILTILQPWIVDWTFSKKEAKEMLSWHGIELQDDFEIIENESGGFTDYVQTFTLELSKSDFTRIAEDIRTSKNFKGFISNSAKEWPSADYRLNDTVDYETSGFVKREYYTNVKKEDGTFHFYIDLIKSESELRYFAINE
ncbi:hypothetical protein QYS49_23840 [Marivirga salinae]|uniref:Uncharacterized protein n=1 Tax=Marivirga salinarum TaxID=3059078 RepID=A0AA49GAD4_9BACT|nr:hypothetical protein [Marivirga sp. BDSF4-3]WKK74703.2 hypothetical protein QYS49_23840 [Marivirga sp. BDSF4-3]